MTDGSVLLAGNGAELVRERAMAMRVQAALERMYRLDRVADVADFVRSIEFGEREALLVREAGDGGMEVSVCLPTLAPVAHAELDTLCQIIEGVSHFVYLVERTRVGRESTQLELELQAEVDKWVVLAASMQSFDATRSRGLRARLYERVSFTHGPQTELGERYRLANEAANRFVRHLERDYLLAARFDEMHAELRRFFDVGQEEKLRFSRAI